MSLRLEDRGVSRVLLNSELCESINGRVDGRGSRMGKTEWKALPSKFLIQWERERQIREVEKERRLKKRQLGIEVTGSTASHWSPDVGGSVFLYCILEVSQLTVESQICMEKREGQIEDLPWINGRTF